MSEDFPPYHLYHPDMPRLLLRGESTFFVNLVEYNFNRFAGQYGCSVTISPLRTLEVFDAWRRDSEAWLAEMNRHQGTKGLDHFKQAGILAFWLRRRLVIERIHYLDPEIESGLKDPFPIQERFVEFGNEVASFFLGFHFCFRYEFEQRSWDLPTAHLDDDYVATIATLLKRKNVSPHAMYLIYKSLFTDFGQESGERDLGG